jgi:predicted Zn finger-like uncharacterized protein
MIVTCPSCAVRYLVDARALGAKGRMVRCARCAETWHQAAPRDDLPAADSSPARDAPPPLAAPPPLEPPPRERAPDLTAEQRRQLPAVPRRRRPWGAALAWTLTAITLLAGIGYAAIVERDRIVGVLPAAAALYARAGFPASDSGLGLEFRNVTTSREMANGLPSLVVAGEVKNVSSIARAVPKLVVILRDRSEHDLQDLTVAVPAERLLPGESVPFHASITQPAEAASGVVVTFAGGSRS